MNEELKVPRKLPLLHEARVKLLITLFFTDTPKLYVVVSINRSPSKLHICEFIVLALHRPIMVVKQLFVMFTQLVEL